MLAPVITWLGILRKKGEHCGLWAGDGPTPQEANPFFQRTLQSSAGATQRLGIEGEGLAQRAEFDATVVEATQQQLVTPRLGIFGDDLDDFEAVVDPKLLAFPIVVDGEQGIALIGVQRQLFFPLGIIIVVVQIGAEDQLTGGRQGSRAGGFRGRMAIRSGGLNRNHRRRRCHQRGRHRSNQLWKQVATFIVWHSPREVCLRKKSLKIQGFKLAPDS